MNDTDQTALAHDFEVLLRYAAEQKFASAEALKKQISEDVHQTRNYFKKKGTGYFTL